MCFATTKMYTLAVVGDDTTLQEIHVQEDFAKTLPSPVDELFMFVLHSKYAKMATTRGKLYYVSGKIFKYLDLAAPSCGWRSIQDLAPATTWAGPDLNTYSYTTTLFIYLFI